MINSYQELALKAPEDYKVTGYEILCDVKLHGLTCGDMELYGHVTAKMKYDDATDAFEPVKVVFSIVDDGETYTEVDNDTLTQAMFDAYERFDGEFNSSNVREI